MSTTSSFCTTNTWEKVHAFTNHGTLGPSKKPRKLEWEFNQVVQDAKLPFIEIVISPNGKLMVRCKICTDIDKHEKLHVPKFDGLQKHVSHQKDLATKLEVTKGLYYFNSTNQHAKNECQITTLHDKSYVFYHFQARSYSEYKHKFMQFVTIYHISKHGCPIIDY